jgi:hypothetical protein
VANKKPIVHTEKKPKRKAAAAKVATTTTVAKAPVAPGTKTRKPSTESTAARKAARQKHGTPPPAVAAQGSPAPTPPQSVTPSAFAVAPAGVIGVVQSYSGLVVQPPQYDPASGQAAFNALAPNRAALSKVTVARVDVQATALVALGVYGFVTQATQLHAQFQALDGAGLFSTSTLEGLKTAGLAAIYAFNQAESEGAFKTDAVVPAQLVADASVVEQRMKTRCEYVFPNDPEVTPLLDMLRPGTGYNDLANDLLGYASIYESQKAKIVATNDPNYVATDLADAKSYAGQILAYLTAAMGPQAATAYDALQRSYTLLSAIYTEVRAVGLMLVRFDPQGHTHFPSLTSAVRAAAPKRTKKTAAATGAVQPAAAAAAGASPAAGAAGAAQAPAAQGTAKAAGQ